MQESGYPGDQALRDAEDELSDPQKLVDGRMKPMDLTPEEYAVIRGKGTDAAHEGEYANFLPQAGEGGCGAWVPAGWRQLPPTASPLGSADCPSRSAALRPEWPKSHLAQQICRGCPILWRGLGQDP